MHGEQVFIAKRKLCQSFAAIGHPDSAGVFLPGRKHAFFSFQSSQRFLGTLITNIKPPQSFELLCFCFLLPSTFFFFSIFPSPNKKSRNNKTHIHTRIHSAKPTSSVSVAWILRFSGILIMFITSLLLEDAVKRFSPPD